MDKIVILSNFFRSPTYMNFDPSTWPSLAQNVLGGILAGLAVLALTALVSLSRRKLHARRFKQIFGPQVSQQPYTLIYAPLAPPDPPPKYTKPDGDQRVRFSISHAVSVAELRACNYLASAIAKFAGITPLLRSTIETEGLDFNFVSLGGPESNRKTKQCQSNPANLLAAFDQLNDRFVKPSNSQPLVQFKSGFDYGLILKIRPSQFSKRVWLACAGRGEWGTSGAAWFLAHKWQQIREQAGDRPFAAIVRVNLEEGDQSAEIESPILS